MSIKVTQLGDVEARPRKVAIGTFDGVHVGHRKVIEGADTVLTFEPHPLSVLHPEAAPKLIMPFAAKRDVIDGLGVDEIVIIPFDQEFSELAAEDFISKLLVEALGATEVSVGENFRFGARAKGSPEMLAEREEFSTRVVPLIEVGGETVSSTRIRALVAAGDVEGAMAASARRSCSRERSSSGDRRGSRRSGSRRRTSLPVRDLVVSRPRRVRGVRERAALRRERGGEADLRHRPRPPRRDLHDRPGRATSTGRS